MKLILTPSGTIKATGSGAAINRWITIIREQKTGIIDLLECGAGDALHRRMQDRYLEAIAAEPFVPVPRNPAATVTAEDELAIRSWLAQIEETDLLTIAQVVGQCQQNTVTRSYFTSRATEQLPQLDPLDDRHTCNQCANLIGRRCHAAKRGEISVCRNYELISDMLQRCEGYAPDAHEPDIRHDRKRWPWPIRKEGKLCKSLKRDITLSKPAHCKVWHGFRSFLEQPEC